MAIVVECDTTSECIVLWLHGFLEAEKESMLVRPKRRVNAKLGCSQWSL